QIVRDALTIGITVTEVTARAAAKLSDAVTPQGIAAVCRLPETDPAAVWSSRPSIAVVLVAAADTGNTGTIVRLADAHGADVVVLTGESTDPFSPKAVRASAGSIFHVPIVQVEDPAALLVDLADAGLM